MKNQKAAAGVGTPTAATFETTGKDRFHMTNPTPKKIIPQKYSFLAIE